VLATIALSVLMLLLLAPGPNGQSVLTAAIDRYRGAVTWTNDAGDTPVEETSQIFSTDPETASADAAGALRRPALEAEGILDREQPTLFGETATLGLIDAAHDGSLEARNDAVGEIIRDILSEGQPGPFYGQPSNIGFGGSAKGGYAAGGSAGGSQGAGAPLSGAFGGVGIAGAFGASSANQHGENPGHDVSASNTQSDSGSDSDGNSSVAPSGGRNGNPGNPGNGSGAGYDSVGNGGSVPSNPQIDFVPAGTINGDPNDHNVTIYPGSDAPSLLPDPLGSGAGNGNENATVTTDAAAAPVPEPTSLGLFGSGLVLVARMLRTRRRA
jgi:PEP-CTERM motif